MINTEYFKKLGSNTANTTFINKWVKLAIDDEEEGLTTDELAGLTEDIQGPPRPPKDIRHEPSPLSSQLSVSGKLLDLEGDLLNKGRKRDLPKGIPTFRTPVTTPEQLGRFPRGDDEGYPQTFNENTRLSDPAKHKQNILDRINEMRGQRPLAKVEQAARDANIKQEQAANAARLKQEILARRAANAGMPPQHPLEDLTRAERGIQQNKIQRDVEERRKFEDTLHERPITIKEKDLMRDKPFEFNTRQLHGMNFDEMNASAEDKLKWLRDKQHEERWMKLKAQKEELGHPIDMDKPEPGQGFSGALGKWLGWQGGSPKEIPANRMIIQPGKHKVEAPKKVETKPEEKKLEEEKKKERPAEEGPAIRNKLENVTPRYWMRRPMGEGRLNERDLHAAQTALQNLWWHRNHMGR